MIDPMLKVIMELMEGNLIILKAFINDLEVAGIDSTVSRTVLKEMQKGLDTMREQFNV